MPGFRQENAQNGRSRLWDCLDDETSSKKSADDGLECPVCWEGFNNADNLPYVLWCGHSLCKSCVMGLQWAVVKLPVVPVQLPLLISCPWCQVFSCRVVWKGNIKYPCKNFSLLWMVESVRGDVRQCHDISCAEDKPLMGGANTPRDNQHVFEDEQRRHCHGNGVDQANTFSLRQLPWLANLNIRGEQPAHVFFLCRWVNSILGLGAQLMAKFMILVLVMFIVFYVLPFSAVILVVYFAATFIFAFPSFLMVYFSLPSLSWLFRELIT